MQLHLIKIRNTSPYILVCNGFVLLAFQACMPTDDTLDLCFNKMLILCSNWNSITKH